MRLLQSRMTLLLLVLGIVVVGVLGLRYSGGLPSEDSAGVAPAANVELDYAFEVRDERQLVGEADNVFVGRVVEHAGSERTPAPMPGVPADVRTQFSVEVKKNIKGGLGGLVEVSQEGGYVEYAEDRGRNKGENRRELVLLEGDPLLEPGKKYLFVTNHDQEKGYHQISTPGYGDVPVTNDKQEKDLVQKFGKAKNEQIDPTKTRVASEDIPAEYLEEGAAHGHQ